MGEGQPQDKFEIQVEESGLRLHIRHLLNSITEHLLGIRLSFFFFFCLFLPFLGPLLWHMEVPMPGV